ncbi:MAG: DNA polymerase I [candidate division Zixibacteria bacterium]|nr:DNA polymerase I [candidate division Zixibacteria bacterium]
MNAVKTKEKKTSADSASGRQTLFLIDGSALIYRSYFAFIRNPLINSRGENTSASFGFTGALLKILREENPDYVAVIFDTKAPTFRHKMYPEYKSTRAKMPDDLVDQLPRIREVVEALNIASFELEGYEADDIIGTFAKKGEEAGLDVWVASGDKDFCQLVNDHVRIYNSKRASDPPQRLDREGVKERMGVYPELIIDLLAMMGDSSDNIPGIPGVGPKTALALLEQFGGLEQTLKCAKEIKANGVRNKVLANKESALLSKELVTINLETPLEFELDTLRRRKADPAKSGKLFSELEFGGFLKQLDLEAPASAPAKTVSVDNSKYRCLSSIKELEELLSEFSELTEVSIDTETTSLNQLDAELVGVSLSPHAGSGYYVPLGHTNGKNLDKAKALKALGKFLLNGDVEKTGQNIKYDLHVFKNAGLDVANVGFDTMLAAYIVDPTARKYSLDHLALERCGYQMQPISDLIGSGKNQKSFADVSIDDAVFYAAEDADLTYRLRGILQHDLVRLGAEKLYYELELPLIPVLFEMERAGVNLDTAFLAEMSDELEKDIDAMQRAIFHEVGHEFNLNSPQQLATALFDELGLPTKGKTAKKTGYSTDVRVLEGLASLHPVPEMVLQYRQLSKLKSTYVDALPALVNENTGRVHTTFNQTIAATGRLSSTDPNLQNIPIRTELGSQIRKAFIPRDKNYQILSADYSQVELRILAHISGDKGLVTAFKNNEDIHCRTAAEVFGVALEDVTPDQRRVAKTANFAVIYGVSAYGLSQQSDMNVHESKEFIETYFERYAGIKKYMNDTLTFARKNGYVETLTGRRRQIADLDAKNMSVRQFAERVAINTPIQGAAADIIKLAMLRIHDDLKGMDSMMTLQVHDELVFDARKSEIDRLTEIVRNGMESAFKLSVPLVVDIGVGDNWLEAK